MTRVESTDAIIAQLKTMNSNFNNNNNGDEVDDISTRKRSGGKMSRISSVDNSSVIDYGIVTPAAPPPLPTPSTPVTHFGRNSSGRSTFARDTSRSVENVGAAREASAGSRSNLSLVSNGSPARRATSVGVLSPAVIEVTPPSTPTKPNGMYKNLPAEEHQYIQGYRNRYFVPKPKGQNVAPANNLQPSNKRHRKNDDDKMSIGAACCLTLLVIVAQILLHGLVGLVIYWVIAFHTEDGKSFPFGWTDNPEKQFNLHPVLMIVGFIYFSGQAILFYRSCRCCRRIWNKFFHTLFHMLAIPCIALAFIAVLESHNNRKDSTGKLAPIPNFYSLHSWMGLTTMGLFAIQFVVGFFSFLLLVCCDSATASFRASLVPVHSAFGLTTFVLAIATACTGFTEKAFFKLSTKGELTSTVDGKPEQAVEVIGNEYMEFVPEGIIINTMGCALVALAILVPCIIKFDPFRKGIPPEGGVAAESVDEDDI